MKNTKFYAIAIFIGTLGGIVTMAFHPTGNDLLNPADEVARRNEMIATGVHILAIVCLPIVFFGLQGFSRLLSLDKPIVSAALIVYGFGLLAVMNSAVFSGLVGTTLTRRILESEAAERGVWRALLHYNGLLNQGFSKVYVIFVSVALILWSIAFFNRGKLPKITAVIGFLVGAFGLLGLLSGHLRLDVHGFGLYIFAQSVWLVLVGIFMFRDGNDKND